MTTSISIAEFRENMAAYLEKVKMLQKPLVFGKRNKPEFVIIPTMSDEDREMYESAGFWNRLKEARKSKSLSLNETKKILDIE